ncbi:MAG: DUF2303 family protein [Mycobacterium sp.]|nr:DUF2303 family protein [Mycobacterium sp.]
MPELKPLTVPVEAKLSTITPVATTPNPADIIETLADHLRYAVSVTEQHGLQVERISEHDDLPTPYRTKGTRTVADLDSFLAELARRSLTYTGTLWGNADRGQLTAIYNDHDSDGAPGWRDDQLTLKLTTDEDWAAWHKFSGTYFSQEDFGNFIEELLHTIVHPDQADLLEVIDSIRASTKGEFESGIERANGGQKLVYKQEHTVKAGRTGQLEVPQFITLELRPWEGHPQTYLVEAYFRVRVNDGKLGLTVKLKPTRQILRTAWADMTTKVIEATAKPVYAQP